LLSLPWADPAILAAMAAAVALGYTLFGFGGFGANIVALPLLAHWMPLKFAVPMLLTLDVSAAAFLGLRNRKLVARDELLRLAPWLLLGMLVGATVLARAGDRLLLALLGGFVIVVAAWSLVADHADRAARARRAAHAAPRAPISPRWATPTGLVGGVFSALFGSGGPVYTTYLAARLPEPARLRATVATIILGAALVRGALFVANGLLFQTGVLGMSLALLPAAALGYFVGSHLHHRLPAARVRQGVWLLLIASGTSLLWRSLG
jgi:uncharacterized protein